MKTISPESFALICFLILMENGEGIIDKSPSYITEKSYLLNAGTVAFGALDLHNKRKVRRWCDIWDVEMPQEAKDNLMAEEEAFKELKAQGFNL